MTDWAKAAAAEIVSELCDDSARAQAYFEKLVLEIIEEHCPFKRNTSYMEVPAQEIDRDTNPKV